MTALWLLLPGFVRTAIIAALAALLGIGAGYAWGRWDGHAACNADKLKAQIAALQFDLETAQQLADLGFAQTKKQEQRSQALKDKVTEYEQELAKRPNPACRLDDDDVRRLRDLSR